MQIGYHASHEQFSPRRLLQLVQRAEEAGFTDVLSSDHFMPWSSEQEYSGFAWSWLGAALQATKNMTYGVVNAPGQRYHPAIIAQAAATLGEMYPQRFWLAVGSGEALNEHITGTVWPSEQARDERLFEAQQVIRRLWSGEMVSHTGHIRVEQAKLFVHAPEQVPLIGAAMTVETAQWVAGWADGMITVSCPLPQLKKIVQAFRNAGGEGKPVYLKMQVSYGRTYDEALQGAWEQWRTCIFPSDIATELTLPQQFAAVGQYIQPEDVAKMVLVSDETAQFAEWISKYAALGFEKIILHNVNTEQELFIDTFGSKVLPELKTGDFGR